LEVLETTLRLTHPVMPYITEEIWQRVAPLAGEEGETIMKRPYPNPDPECLDPASEAAIEWLMALLLGVRRIRGEMNIPPGKLLTVLLEGGTTQDRDFMEHSRDYLHRIGRIESIRWLETGETAPESAIALVGELKALIPMSGLIDKAAELARLDREIQRIARELPRLEAKLTDPGFLDKAPAAVVEKERTRLLDLRSSQAELQAQAARIESL
jgi:valyl-tRNA synthetase